MKSLIDAALLAFEGTLLPDLERLDADEVAGFTLGTDVADTLSWLHDLVAVGVVVDADGLDDAQVRNALDHADAAPFVDTVVTSRDVGAASPDPKPWLIALDRLGFSEPNRVLIVGSRPAHEEAAQAAGMAYVDVTDTANGPGVRAAVETWRDRHAGHRFEEARARITQADLEAAHQAAARNDLLAKPVGSLGRLEQVAVTLAGIAGVCPPPVPEPATVAVFAADHGIVSWNVSPWPQEATACMVSTVLKGGAAVNVLARQAGATVVVVDVGLATPVDPDGAPLIERRVRRGTGNLAEGPAMSRTDVLLALDVGAEIAARAVSDGARCLITGDLGIGNTTTSTALVAAVTNRPADEVTGRGSGADDEMLARKVKVVEAVTENLSVAAGPLTLLEEIGGLEIAATVGFIVGGAAERVPILIDGAVGDAALLIAAQLAPEVVDYVLTAHRAADPAAAASLAYLGLQPVIDADCTIGEGSGALMLLPTVQAAARILTEMATLDEAGIEPCTA